MVPAHGEPNLTLGLISKQAKRLSPTGTDPGEGVRPRPPGMGEKNAIYGALTDVRIH